jgi:pimeloyl-ACP methyl ester carboxylesterase
MSAPVVFVHDLRGSTADWPADDWPTDLPVATLVELPGHGSAASVRFTVPGAVTAILGAIDAVDEPPVVVGAGIGAHLAALAISDRVVRGLVAVGCGTEPLGWLADSYRIASVTAPLLGESGAAVSGWAASTFVGDASRQPGFEAVLGQLHRLDVRENLRRVDAPVRLLNGSRDRYRMQERAFLRACRNGRLVRVAGSTARLTEPDVATALAATVAELAG